MKWLQFPHVCFVELGTTNTDTYTNALLRNPLNTETELHGTVLAAVLDRVCRPTCFWQYATSVTCRKRDIHLNTGWHDACLHELSCLFTWSALSKVCSNALMARIVFYLTSRWLLSVFQMYRLRAAPRPRHLSTTPTPFPVPY